MNDEQANPAAPLPPHVLAKSDNDPVKQPSVSSSIDALAMAGFVASLIVPVSLPLFVLAHEIGSWVTGLRAFTTIGWVWFALISSSFGLGLSIYAKRNRHLAAQQERVSLLSTTAMIIAVPFIVLTLAELALGWWFSRIIGGAIG